MLHREQELTDQIKERSFQSIETESPIQDPRHSAQQRAIQGLKRRFNTYRIVFFTLGIVFWASLLFIPLLTPESATFVSFSLGTLTVILGVAARPVLEQIIAGFVLAMDRTIRVGDTVIVDNHYGVVERLDLTSVVFRLWDWRRYVVPNEVLLNKEFLNLSLNDTFEWTHVDFHIAPNEDIDAVSELAVRAMQNSSSLADHEDPSFWVMEMTPESIRCRIAGWSNSPWEAWSLRDETRKGLMRAFREKGIRSQLGRIHYESEQTPIQ